MRAALCFSFSLFALGCGTSSSNPPDSGPTVNCQNSPIAPGADAQVTPYASNLTAASADGTVQVVLVGSNPAPPPVMVQTTWTVQINDGSGHPLPNATLSVPLPYMPFHGHYTDQQPAWQQGSNGQWTVSNLYFFMPGVWQVTFDVTNASSSESVLFHLCVD